jgi:hypothetical protein
VSPKLSCASCADPSNVRTIADRRPPGVDPHDAFACCRRLKTARGLFVCGNNFSGSVAARCSILHRHFSTDTALREVNVTLRSASGMPVYRIYKLNALGHVTGHALVLICEKDADVVRKVESLVDGHDVEILEGARLVGRVKSVAGYPTNQARPPMPSSADAG